MVFSSEVFLFAFLPSFLVLYYLTPTHWKSLTILLGSYAFYAWWRVDFLALMILTTVWTWAFGRLITRDPSRAGLWTGIGVVGCLAVLGVFKYLNFFMESLAALVGTTASELGYHWQLILPIGISFYVFQCVSYLVDVHRRDVSQDVPLLDFAAFIALFPQLIAGPILRFKDLADQFRDREHSVDLFIDGMTRFFIGLAKKVLLADAVAPIANLAFASEDPSFTLAWIGALAYALQLYFDFSGYSDMAVGLGKMLGFRFMENFDTPYVSRSITEFWRRWHISLSTWLRDYLYIPLGGNRAGPRRTYFNLIAVMVLGGLWHGAAWTFVIWGFWHGLWLAIERATGLARSATVAGLLRTLVVILVGWVMFRSLTVAGAFDIYAGMLGLNGFETSAEVVRGITREGLTALACCIGVTVFEPLINRRAAERWSLQPGAEPVLENTVLPTLAVTVLAAITVLKLSEQSFSPFLYFQF